VTWFKYQWQITSITDIDPGDAQPSEMLELDGVEQ